ncbi:hypothetical protein LOK49_LG02G00124 [Camellia lanceoleosa]|uniref:Uncharacterized protein n=1 Tax=Camellia lanceoleosa TaxID=1840588 RepID=A0ACC0IGB3_9ERIC|nr:hypothetical protein LOK49_LG02G00124 [Camellia lanceoleosa]
MLISKFASSTGADTGSTTGHKLQINGYSWVEGDHWREAILSYAIKFMNPVPEITEEARAEESLDDGLAQESGLPPLHPAMRSRKRARLQLRSANRESVKFFYEDLWMTSFCSFLSGVWEASITCRESWL